jgi:integrase
MTDRNSTPTTTAVVRALPITESRYEEKTGTPGLRVRVSPKAGRHYRWYYSHPYKLNKQGKPLRFVLELGDADEIGYGAAGDALDDARAKIKSGLAPVPAKGTASSDADIGAAPTTVMELCEKFYTQRIVTIRDRPEVVRQLIDSVVVPEIGGVSLDILTQDHLLIPCHKLVARGRTAHAKSTFKILCQMMKWATARKQHDNNPLLGLSLTDAGIPDNSRPGDRVLNDEEIALFFNHLTDSRVCEVKKLALRLLLLTGCRTREIRLNTWDNMDFDNAVLTIPLELLKTRKKVRDLKPLRIPLAPEAVLILRRLHKMNADTGYICGESTTGKPLGERTLYNTIKMQLTKLNMPSFHVHDLRRTHRTLLGTLSVPYEVAEAAIGHVLPVVVRTYAVGDLFDKRRDAAVQLAGHVTHLIGGGTETVTLRVVA